MIRLRLSFCLPEEVKCSVMYGLSIIFMKGLSLIMLPFLTHAVSQAEYGKLEVLVTLATIGSVVAGMGLSDALFKYCGLAKNQREVELNAQKLISFSVAITVCLLALSYVFTPLISLFIPSNPSFQHVLLVWSLIAFEGFIAVCLGWLRMQDQVGRFCLITCGRAFIQLIGTLIFVELGFGITGILSAALLGCVLQCIALFYCVRGVINFKTRLKDLSIYIQYSAPIMLSGIIAFFLFGVDKWVLAFWSTLEIVAIYAVGLKIAMMLVILLQPYTMWWAPKRFQILKQRGTADVLFYTSLGLVIAGNIAIILSAMSPILLDLFVPEHYLSALWVIGPLVLAMLAKESVELVNIGCFIGRSSHLQLVINAVSAMCVLCTLFYFTPEHGMVAVAWCLCGGQFLRLILFYMASQYYLPIAYPFKSFLFLLGMSAVFSLGHTEFNLDYNVGFIIVYLCLFNIVAAKCVFNISLTFSWKHYAQLVRRFTSVKQ